jgi:hypothetical protein
MKNDRKSNLLDLVVVSLLRFLFLQEEKYHTHTTSGHKDLSFDEGTNTFFSPHLGSRVTNLIQFFF